MPQLGRLYEFMSEAADRSWMPHTCWIASGASNRRGTNYREPHRTDEEYNRQMTQYFGEQHLGIVTRDGFKGVKGVKDRLAS
jgi:hypothetical protein